jgi:hypothetical protein
MLGDLQHDTGRAGGNGHLKGVQNWGKSAIELQKITQPLIRAILTTDIDDIITYNPHNNT